MQQSPFVRNATEAARKASRIIGRALNRMGNVHVYEKGHNDLVTDVDRACEQIIIDTLRGYYPDHSFISEECGEIWGNDRDAVWIIDPLDGTTNFVHGYPHYAISIALRLNGKLAHAVVYDPLKEELFTASHGRGAALNDHRMRVTSRSKLDGALISLSASSKKDRLPHYMKQVEAIHGRVAGVRRGGSTVLDLAYVASGRLDMMWCDHAKIWDMAAGALLVREAGGMLTDLSGGEDYLTQGQFVAGHAKMIQAGLKTLS
jgi:myo-inositol-1(or 4)-monophosphatase